MLLFLLRGVPSVDKFARSQKREQQVGRGIFTSDCIVDIKLVFPIAAAATLAFACGPWSQTEADSHVSHQRVTDGKPLGSALEVRAGGEIDLALRVTNNSKRTLELLFPDGFTHDFFVLDAEGREVWRWSKGRMFTSALQTRLLRSTGSVTYHNTAKQRLPKGEYTAVAVLRSGNHPMETRVAFVQQ